MRAEALYALGRTDTALEWLEAIGDGIPFAIATANYVYQDIAPSYLLQGKIHEEKGNFERAIHYYARFIETWQRADSEFQPTVEDARQRLERLILLQARELFASRCYTFS